MPAFKCADCGKRTERVHPILDIPLCQKCQKRDQAKYAYVTKTRAMSDFRLKPADLAQLGVHEVDNPHYKKAAPMQLYLLTQVRELSRQRWGSDEPYIVSLADFNPQQLQWLLDDPERLKALSPDKFQRLIADRLEGMGFGVQLVGNVYAKDGGVDIIASPAPRVMPFPFLLAVQAKHHHTDNKTPVGDVRDLHGVVTASNSFFRVGMAVTNTSFTADAKWFAENNKAFLRLRSLEDLLRWLKNDFVNEHEWREMPDEIELAPGIKIAIPKPKELILSNSVLS